MLTELTIKEFINKVLSNDPVPGGGSVSALNGALATDFAVADAREDARVRARNAAQGQQHRQRQQERKELLHGSPPYCLVEMAEEASAVCFIIQYPNDGWQGE